MRGDPFGAEEYRKGALERLGEAYTLLRDERFAGSIYLAGRGVEGMLRAVLWRSDPEVSAGKTPLDTGHDLRELLVRVRALGLLKPGRRDDDFQGRVQQVARLWFNNMRFASTSLVESRWRAVGEVTRRRTLKRAANAYYDSCSAIIKRCEALYAGTPDDQ